MIEGFFSSALDFGGNAETFDGFKVRDIRIESVQRDIDFALKTHEE